MTVYGRQEAWEDSPAGWPQRWEITGEQVRTNGRPTAQCFRLEGVRCDPAPGNPATTLCTFIADLTAGEAVIAARDDQPVAIPLQDLAEGDPRTQRPFASLGH